MKFQHKIAAALLFVSFAGWAAAPHSQRVAPLSIVLSAPKALAETPKPAPRGALRVADVRALPKAAPIAQWETVDGGYVAHFTATSATASGVRVRLDLGTVPGAMEVRVRGADSTRVETMVLDPMLGNEAWTPWTEGETQAIEVFSPVAPSERAVSVGAILHFTASPVAKAALSCTLSTACTSGDPSLDAQIEERKKSVMRIQFVDAGGGFVCSATLIDTPRNPAAYALTANHCIDTAAAAGTITSFWFYESVACGTGGISPAFVQTAGGAQFVFTNPNADTTLVLMNRDPPAGARYSPISSTQIPTGAQVISISHPDGDTSRWADGTMTRLVRANDVPYDTYWVKFSRGLIQGGSSGSGAFVRANGRLELSGVLSFGPDEESCTATEQFGLYERMEVFFPQMAQYVGASSPGEDDAPNLFTGATTPVTVAPIDTVAQPAVTISRRIDYAGDLDVFRFTVASTVAVSAYTQGSLDTVAAILDVNGVELEANDDVQTIDNNAGITRVLEPGTYYFHVGHWVPSGTGPYQVVLRADRVDANNYTALWWNPQESGWGINLDHQGDIIFATLFTYDESGAPMWLVMSRGDRQADGSYSGQLFRTTGPAFNASPWTAINASQVGTMRLTFSGKNDATLSYTYNGRSVTKTITRQVFKTLPTCSWSIFDRSFEFNVQDLWWNPAESGWGINLAHQDDTIFATLFTYDANGRGMWLVMPDGEADATGVYTGKLYSTRGPAFDAQPWGTTTPTEVGAMSLDFKDGNSATLNYTVNGLPVQKTIQRQVFSSPKTKCES